MTYVKCIIEQAVFDVRYSSQKTANECEHNFSNFCYKKLLPVLDLHLNKINTSNNIVIDYLELNVGEVNVDNFESEFVFKLVCELEQFIANVTNAQLNTKQVDFSELINKTVNNFSEHDSMEVIRWILSSGYFKNEQLSNQFKDIYLLFIDLLAKNPNAVSQFIIRSATNVQTNILFRLINLVSNKELLLYCKTMVNFSEIHNPVLFTFLLDKVELFLKENQGSKADEKCLYTLLIGSATYKNISQLSMSLEKNHVFNDFKKLINLDEILDPILASSLALVFDKKVENNNKISIHLNTNMAQFTKAIKANNKQGISYLWDKLIINDAQFIISFIANYSNKDHLIKLLSETLNDAQLFRMIENIGQEYHSSVYSIFILTTQHKTINDTAHNGNSADIETPDYRLLSEFFWHVTLSYLFVERGSFYNKKSYLSYMFHSFSYDNSFDYIDLLYFYQRLFLGVSDNMPLLLIINELVSEAGADQKINSMTLSGEIIDHQVSFESILVDLCGSNAVNNKKIINTITLLIKRSPVLLFKLFNELQKSLNKNLSFNPHIDVSVFKFLISQGLIIRNNVSVDNKKSFLQSIEISANKALNKSSFYINLLKSFVNEDIIDLDTLINKETVGRKDDRFDSTETVDEVELVNSMQSNQVADNNKAQILSKKQTEYWLTLLSKANVQLSNVTFYPKVNLHTVLKSALIHCPYVLANLIENLIRNKHDFYYFIAKLDESLLIEIASIKQGNVFTQLYQDFEWIYFLSENEIFTASSIHQQKWFHIFQQLFKPYNYYDETIAMQAWLIILSKSSSKDQAFISNVLSNRFAQYKDIINQKTYSKLERVLKEMNKAHTNDHRESRTINLFEKKQSETEHNYFVNILVNLFTEPSANISFDVVMKIVSADLALVRQFIQEYAFTRNNREVFCHNLSHQGLIKFCSILYNKKFDLFINAVFNEVLLDKNISKELKLNDIQLEIWTSLFVYFYHEKHVNFNREQSINYVITLLYYNGITLNKNMIHKNIELSPLAQSIVLSLTQANKNKPNKSEINRNILNYINQLEIEKNTKSALESIPNLAEVTELISQTSYFEQLSQRMLNTTFDQALINEIINYSQQSKLNGFILYEGIIYPRNSQFIYSKLSTDYLLNLIENYLYLLGREKESIDYDIARLTSVVSAKNNAKYCAWQCLMRLVKDKFVNFEQIDNIAATDDISTIEYTEQDLIQHGNSHQYYAKALPIGQKSIDESDSVKHLFNAIKSQSFSSIVAEICKLLKTPQSKHALISVLTEKSVFTFLTSTLAPSQLIAILSLFNPKGLVQAIEHCRFFSLVFHYAEYNVSAKQLQLFQWQTLFSYFLTQELVYNDLWFTEQYISSLKKYNPVHYQKLTNNIEFTISSIAFIKPLLLPVSSDYIIEQLIKILSTDVEKVTTPSVKMANKQEKNVNAPSTDKSTEIPHDNDEEKSLIKEEIEQEDIIENPSMAFVKNAGLVLLSPYIPKLFELFSLTKKGEFIDEMHRMQALNVLQYLVSFNIDYNEPDLSLNKLMCGVRLDQPVSTDYTITKEQKDLINSLLSGVIEHWKAIGNTSVDGIRQAFIQRDGALYKNDDNWRLEVMSKPFDMLLDQLPWSFSTIKYSWMNEMIQVKWRG